MIGKMNSNKPYDTWDVDLLITSYHNPSYKEIVSCMKFFDRKCYQSIFNFGGYTIF